MHAPPSVRALRVGEHDEQSLSLQLLEAPRAACGVGGPLQQRGTQSGVEALRQRATQQELDRVGRQAAEHFLLEVARERMGIAHRCTGRCRGRACGSPVAAQVDAQQLQPGGPAVGVGVERADVTLIDLAQHAGCQLGH